MSSKNERRDRGKDFRRAKQKRVEDHKAEAETAFYWQERAKPQGKTPPLAESVLFGTQGTAGINFGQYKELAVERSGPGEHSGSNIVIQTCCG
jgi:hypothetical protein